MERIRKNTSEFALEENIRRFFHKFHDLDFDDSHKGNCCPDIVLKYGEMPIAIIEVKQSIISKDIQEQIRYRFKSYNIYYTSVCFLIVKINNEYWYYDSCKEDFKNEDINTLLAILLKDIYKHANNGDSFIKDFCKKVNNLKKFEKYKNILHKYLEHGKLLTFGSRAFFNEETEINFMKDLLKSEETTKTELCRYTSTRNFIITEKNGRFWLNDIAAMNDALETKALEQYPNLKYEASTVGSHVYKGFIMCFSRDSTDKLMNWNMYGDSGKGVCYSIKDIRNAKDFYFAPIVYVTKGKKHTILSFLDYLSGLSIGNSIHFHLRLWHIWKYFFKYDYYEGEKEERLLYVTIKQGKEDWSEKYGISHHVEIKRDEMPFKIKSVIMGPHCAKPIETKKILEEYTKHKYVIRKSSIKGYRG